MHNLKECARVIRSQLASLNVPSNAKPTVAVKTTNPKIAEMLSAEKDVLQSLSRAGEVLLLASGDSDPDGFVSGFVSDEINVYVKVVGLIDISLELNRLAKRENELKDLMAKLQTKMSKYTDKVPQHVRDQDATKMTKYQNEVETLQA